METLEEVGEKFNLQTFFRARDVCVQVTDQIIGQIEAGMSEAQIKDLVEKSFASVGVKKFWHPSKIRLGPDTTKNFRELSDPNLRTLQGDLCFLDLGPILEDHEADFGRTFAVGEKLKPPIARASEEIFLQTAEKWKSDGLTGLGLFNYASGLADRHGYVLNPLMSGHRLGDFPHKIFSSAKLFELGIAPTENLWVLEIHLIDEKNQRGAFFEDILR